MTKRIFAVLITLAFAVSARAGVTAPAGNDGLSPLRGERVKDGKILLIPEAERPLEFFVMGLDPQMDKYYLLPGLRSDTAIREDLLREAEKNLYWLNFELSHGRILQVLPSSTHLYVALPDPRTTGSLGRERGWFEEYLEVRCGWSQKAVETRIHFFMSPTPLIWAQDTAKILGRDDQGRAVIGIGPPDDPLYQQAIRNLVKTYPEQFTLIQFEQYVSAEGGDQELVWTPRGNVALLAGRHRAMKKMQRTMAAELDSRGITDDMVRRVRESYSRCYYGIPSIILPEKVLRDPSLGSEEIFHLDMLAAVMAPVRGKIPAFVPTFQKEQVDSHTGLKLDPEKIAAIQREYDAAAAQLQGMGYEVVRLAFADDPVRSPVNVGKFRDRKAGRTCVFLSKYPYHLPAGDPKAPQQILRKALGKVVETGDRFTERPDTKTCEAFCGAIAHAWKVMDRVSAMPNPIFEKQAALYRKYGCRVIAVPDFAWGAGGIHCKFMH